MAQFLNPQCAKGEGSGRLRSGAFEGSGKGAAGRGGLSGDCAAARCRRFVFRADSVLNCCISESFQRWGEEREEFSF